MKSMRKILLAGVAAIAAAGLAGAAAAEIKNSHVLTIGLPDGSQEQIRYAGDTPPEVRLQPGRASFIAFPAADAFGSTSPWAALDRISAEMDREAAAVLREVQSLERPLFAGQGGLTQVDLGKLPLGVRGYSVVTTVSGGRTCTRTTEYGATGRRMTTRLSGDCGGGASAGPSPSTAAAGAARSRPAGPLLQVSERY